MAGPAEVVDAAAFLGMHAVDEATRRACKTFFARRLHNEVLMSLEHVGWCDDVVWGHARSVQDAYYPFMDTLHTEMALCRLGYDEADLQAALGTPALQDLPIRARLLMGMVLRRDAVLHTAHPHLAARGDLPVVPVAPAGEQPFPEHLEQLYRASLALRIPTELTRG
ncbi:MAG: DUF6190 family protein [Pseudonocardiaceae bacterium]